MTDLRILAILLTGVVFGVACSSDDDSGLAPAGAIAAPTVSQVVVAVATPPQVTPEPPIEDIIRAQCASCHAYTEPSVLPKRAWAGILARMFDIDGREALAKLRLRDTIPWYTDRAPTEVGVLERAAGSGEVGLDLVQGEVNRSGSDGLAGSISNIQIHDFGAEGDLQFVATDMANGLVMMADLTDLATGFVAVASVPHPARTSLIDLDQDGRLDLLVADLGSFGPGKHEKGQAVWLRAAGGGSFEKHVLGDGFGRVADVEAADFDGDGDVDVVVAEFGIMSHGGVWLLENRTEDWTEPRFERELLDDRGGAIHTAIGDVDGDGAEDIVVLQAEHYEEVSVFLNRGDLDFEHRVIYQAPHPAWGYTGMQMIDFDADGDFDLLLTNGDGFDAGGILQPFHGVQILLNEGNGQFKPEPRLPFRGVYRAEAGDMDGDGDMDIVACAFHPFLFAEERRDMKLDAVIWFEQLDGMDFRRHAIEVLNVDCPTLTLEDFDGDGDLDIATGVFKIGRDESGWAPGKLSVEDGPVLITWENLLND